MSNIPPVSSSSVLQSPILTEAQAQRRAAAVARITQEIQALQAEPKPLQVETIRDNRFIKIVPGTRLTVGNLTIIGTRMPDEKMIEQARRDDQIRDDIQAQLAALPLAARAQKRKDPPAAPASRQPSEKRSKFEGTYVTYSARGEKWEISLEFRCRFDGKTPVDAFVIERKDRKELCQREPTEEELRQFCIKERMLPPAGKV